MSETTAAPASNDAGWVSLGAPADAAPALTPASNILGDAKVADPAPADPAAPAATDPAKPAEGEKPAEEAKAAEPQPVEYTDLKLPEGIAADDPALSAFTGEAAKMGIPQDKAEALLAQVAPKLAEQLTAPYKQWTQTQEAWQAEIKGDAELGGDNFAKMQTTIARALDNPKITDPKMREALVMTGAGNNPAVVRTLYRWASALTEGSHVSGQPAAQRASYSDWYPSMTKTSE